MSRRSIGTPISDEKVLQKNDQFCVKKGSWEPPVSDKKVCVTRKEHFLKLCQEQKSFHIFVKMFEELVYQTITRQPGLPLSMDQHDQ